MNIDVNVILEELQNGEANFIQENRCFRWFLQRTFLEDAELAPGDSPVHVLLIGMNPSKATKLVKGAEGDGTTGLICDWVDEINSGVHEHAGFAPNERIAKVTLLNLIPLVNGASLKVGAQWNKLPEVHAAVHETTRILVHECLKTTDIVIPMWGAYDGHSWKFEPAEFISKALQETSNRIRILGVANADGSPRHIRAKWSGEPLKEHVLRTVGILTT